MEEKPKSKRLVVFGNHWVGNGGSELDHPMCFLMFFGYFLLTTPEN